MNYSYSKLSLLCGAVVILLGGFVLFAWVTNNVILIQIRPTLVPMPINAAIGFMLSGVGLIFLNFYFLREARIAGALTLAMGGLSFLEFLLSRRSLGDLFILGGASYFQPITPNTALCFTLVGMAIFSVSHHRWHGKGTLISGVLGAIIFAFGSLAFFTHLMGVGMAEGAGQIMGMAVHAPGGFGFLAVGLIAFSWRNEQQKVIGSPQWLPVLIGVGVVTVTFGLWIHVDVRQQAILGTAILVFGLLVASVLTVGVHFLQRERRLLEDLHRSHLGLEMEIRERKQMEERLQISQEELRNLSHRLQVVREEEKSKIAREVHDELGQTLTVMKMDLLSLEEEATHDTKAFRQKIQLMADRLDLTVQTVQRICLELRPKILEVFGLLDAIESQTEEFQQRTGIQCRLTTDQENFALDSERSMACFRVLQEALTNVARHAKATQVFVRVIPDKGFFRLEVEDNGRGIEEDEIYNPKSLGLIGIRERIHQLAGTVSITGRRGKGTLLSIRIPYV